MTTWWNRISQAARTRIQAVRGRLSDAGYSVMEWVFITAAGATVAALIYAAINTKVLEKINVIKGS
ncbi:hypothetical protein ACQEU8_35695 [Streptomyces sp. CA-250714]|uniref:hypothetical protein n=1 Tax=Streptomyces sp. CA-250714 TaxID=3240060 RepID=UPI003D92DB08